MGMLDGLRNRMRKKDAELPPLPEEEKPASELGEVTAENVKAKLDLMTTRLDSISTQYAALNERIRNIERLVMEIRSFCK